MSNRIDLTQLGRVFDGGHPKHLFEKVERRFKDGGVRTMPLYLGPQDVAAITLLPELIAELKRCYKQIDLLRKAFMMAGNAGCYMTICEECDDVHTLDDECPFVCEYCDEKTCECPTSE